MHIAIPGPPTELRVSSKRTDTIIKIRWKPPERHPHSVHQYVVEQRMISRFTNVNDEPPWYVAKNDIEKNKLSATMCKLPSDTKYEFRVCRVAESQAGVRPARPACQVG